MIARNMETKASVCCSRMKAQKIATDLVVLGCLSLGLAGGCARSGGSGAEPREPRTALAAAGTTVSAEVNADERASAERPGGAEHGREALEGASARFAAASVDGAFILRREGAVDRTYGGELVDARHLPCSTFKIANALISLEVGAIDGVDATLPWDGVRRTFDSWNQDHDLRSAMESSVVWYFQEIARRVGLARMTSWVERLDYGDRRVGEEVDLFWLEGPLTISPAEEVDFVDRLLGGRLPVAETTAASVREIVPAKAVGDVRVRGKTGTCVFDDERKPHAWLVGWVERGETSLGSFALLLTEGRDVDALVNARWSLALELLGDAGLVEPEKIAR